MPFVNIKTAAGLLSEERKAELTARLTDLLVEIEGRGDPSFRELVWVLIEEHAPEAWCLGGTPVTRELIDTLAGRRGSDGG